MIKLDPVPSKIQITDQNGIPTNSFVMFLSRIMKRFESGITQDIVVMDSPTTYKTLHFTNGLLTSVT